MLTVISPAKRLDFDTPAPTVDTSMPDFLPDSRALNAILRGYSALDLMQLMGVSRNIAELNAARNHEWRTPFRGKGVRAAVLAFQGDVYRGLDAASLNAADLRFAQRHLRILSGLYGVLRPLDLMRAYRLEMGAKLGNPRGKDLYAFWGGKITENLNESLAAHRAKVLVNLASNEYFKAVKADAVAGEVITPVFKERRGGTYKVIALYAKQARGLMSRFIIKHRIDAAADLKGFDRDGYAYNARLSSARQWVFSRG